MYTDLNNDGIVATPTEILWEGQYYPFGLAHKGAWMDTPDKDLNYKYNDERLLSDVIGVKVWETFKGGSRKADGWATRRRLRIKC